MIEAQVNMRKLLGYALWVLVGGLALNAVRVHVPTLKAALLPTGVVPYTVVLQDSALQQTGAAVPTMKLTIAVRSDGSRASDMTSDDPAKLSERILNFSSGKKILIMERDHKKSTTFDRTRGNPARWLANPSDNCTIRESDIHQEVLGEEVVNGYRTVKLTSKLGEGLATQWLALDYGCALVKDRMEWQDGQTSEKKLVALIPGEPTASLFDDPAEFEEVSFSHLFPDLGSSASAGPQDFYYYSHRPPN
jgi:hypothetical protein